MQQTSPSWPGALNSRPRSFEADGSWYCLPENSESRGVTIYQWQECEGCWHRLARLIDEAVLDPTPVLHEGTRYVFGTLLDDGPETQLCIWHSQSLLGPWTRHQHSPTRSGHKDRRSAGRFFSHGNALYRPAQDGSGGYGGAVIIYRVDHLSSETYRETEVTRVVPDPAGLYPSGLHTLSVTDHAIVIDGKTREFAWTAPLIKSIWAASHHWRRWRE
jgi:hypothetical protein